MDGRKLFTGLPPWALLAHATRPMTVEVPRSVVEAANRDADAAERLAQLQAGIPNHVFKMPPGDSAFEAAHGAENPPQPQCADLTKFLGICADLDADE
jgi:hypothetical protein